MTVRVAIVGSGPSGFYTADALIKSGMDCEIDVIDRLPTPFGLIRAGVAPDHQKTKNVSRAYEKTALNDSVAYFGNVDVGQDVGIEALKGLYDAVVLAIGSPYDRKLGVPGEDKKGVFGSADFVGWYNGHPDFRDLEPDLNTMGVVVIGNGNVAIDCARVLVKTPDEMSLTDIATHAADAIYAAPLEDVYMVGRRGPVEAKFTNVELREMGDLQECMPIIDAAQIPEEVPAEEKMSDRDRRLKDKNLGTLRSFVDAEPAGRKRRVHFQFYASPVEILGGDTVEGIRLEKTELRDGRAVGTGETYDIPCGIVIPAIGYQGQPLDGVPFDERNGVIQNDEGRVSEGVYAVGWIRRGPTGVIGTNKHDGDKASQQIQEDCADGGKTGRAGLKELLTEKSVRWVDYSDWQKIDAAEKLAAAEGAPRRKLTRIPEMLAVLDG
jgi:NADPH-dependent glutamate synthase beta subunit-like oxidoreductase